MACCSNAPVHLKVSIGKDRLDNGVKSSISLRVYMGSANAKEKLAEAQAATNGIAQEKRITVVIPVSDDAGGLVSQFQEALDALDEGELTGAVGGMVSRKVSASGSNIIIDVAVSEMLTQQVEMMIGQAQAMAGPLLDQHKNSICLNIGASSTPLEVIMAQNPLFKAFEGIYVQLCMDIKQEFRKQIFEMFGEMIPPPFSLFEGPATLFEQLNWETYFSSVSDLPPVVSQIAQEVTRGEDLGQMIKMMKQQYLSIGDIPEKKIMNLLMMKATGESKIYVNTPIGAATLDIKVPGISTLFM